MLRYLRPRNVAASFAASTGTAGVTAALRRSQSACCVCSRSANQRLRWWPTLLREDQHYLHYITITKHHLKSLFSLAIITILPLIQCISWYITAYNTAVPISYFPHEDPKLIIDVITFELTQPIYGRFTPLSVRPLDDSPPRRFAPWTFRTLDVSPSGLFTLKTFRPLDVSPPDVSPSGRFATTQWTIRPLEW